MRFEFGTALNVGALSMPPALSRGDFRLVTDGRSIGVVIPGVLCLVFRWWVRGAICTTAGAVGFVVVVTGGLGPTLCPPGSPSEVAGTSTL